MGTDNWAAEPTPSPDLYNPSSRVRSSHDSVTAREFRPDFPDFL
jgi:hypothetical protein